MRTILMLALCPLFAAGCEGITITIPKHFNIDIIQGDDTGGDTGPGDTDVDPLDSDFDGFPDSVDCQDGDAEVYPGAVEVPWDGIDNDCSGADLRDWIDVHAGDDIVCGVKSTGAALCWGLTTGDLAAVQPGPFTSVVASDGFACGVGVAGGTTCWGAASPALPAGGYSMVDAYGDVCGLTSTGDVLCAGQEVPAEDVDHVTVGLAFVCTLDAWGTISCWDGGIPVEQDVGQLAPPAGDEYAWIDAGASHACAIRLGEIVCWGSNVYGQSTPPAGATWSGIAAGARHSCAIDAVGAPTCWGSDDVGQSTPVSLPPPVYEKVTAGINVSCGLDAAGTITCWGSNAYGQATVPA